MINRKKQDELDLNVIIQRFETHRGFGIDQNAWYWNPKRDLGFLAPADQNRGLRETYTDLEVLTLSRRVSVRIEEEQSEGWDVDWTSQAKRHFLGFSPETQNVAELNPAKQQTKAEYKSSNGSENDHATSSRLHSSCVNHPFDPTIQQKRSYGATTGFENASETEEAVDARKPTTRSKEEPAYYSLAKDVFSWKPEQLDSADGALKRARKLFEESEKRGVPEHPQSKVLRELRGESF
ncbi:hypothetical protein FEM48_Zijuj09G0016600 [Ziziphus jujuba var. spinosa]|uniref:Uncharacterized protein n=1 Tax=Ziziphus jujuba var. spinosa TaxID=714518 RepID=A0A978UQ60_ZIZJJ|nr:hypothetical protein FEM48_Zijuj09G0016600 [Ziziphus jujuba var. spinosa]